MKKTITTSNKTAIFFIGIFLSLMITTALTSSIIPAVFAAQHGGDKQKFTAQLSGDQQAPPVQTSATGSAWFKPMQDSVSFEVNVSDIQGVTMAHIHSGKQGENGPPIVPLFKSDTPSGQMSGVLAKGNVTADTFQGPMAGKTISDLITAMQNGETYVNIHTQQNPDGEIRGQIMVSNSTTKMMK
jgi:CHRD domain